MEEQGCDMTKTILHQGNKSAILLEKMVNKVQAKEQDTSTSDTSL